MADKSKIEWTDATWNPIRGCSVVSEGCRNCYAMSVAARFNKPGQAYEDLGYRNDSGPHWTGVVKLIEEHLEDPLRWQRPRMIFVNSMSDLFHEEVPYVWIDRIFEVMYKARHHQFQVLTKRPERMFDYISRNMWLTNDPLPNVWLGVSVEDQESADERIPILIDTPASVRWISAEPLLGPIDLQAPWSMPNDEYPDLGIHWVVAGGESGPGARPMHPEWARSLRDQCVAAGVPFFFKQWGQWGPITYYSCRGTSHPKLPTYQNDGFEEIPLTDERVLQNLKPMLGSIGKKLAGRLLDGREWDEYPSIAEGGA